MGKLKIAVIGAGVSGLACGRALRAAGVEVVVFEKSRSLGGRLATRRWEGQVVDHGAPWFAKVPEELGDLCQGDLRRVAAPVLDRRRNVALTEPAGGRWYLPAGNNRIAKALAGGLEVRMEALIESIRQQDDGRWQVADENFDAVVLTAPWPQARRLVAPWQGEPAGLIEPQYVRTLTAFFEYDGDPSGPAAAWSAMEHDGDPSGLERSICENHKTGRILPGRTVMVAHGTPGFSEENFDADREAWAGRLEREIREAWGFAKPAQASFTHRWGFSTVVQPFRETPDLPDGIFLAGDAVGGSTVGAAYESGLAAAQAVLTGIRA